MLSKKGEIARTIQCLLDDPGMGKTLALTIMLETGPISRFGK